MNLERSLLNIDCMEYMRTLPDQAFDLAVVDPPYYEGPNRKEYYGNRVNKISRSGRRTTSVVNRVAYRSIENWQVPEPDYFTELARVSRHQIIWGANHFADRFNSASSSWIVWDKENGASSFADGELAYTSFHGALRIYRYMWNGMHQGQIGGSRRGKDRRIHPTQKPVQLYDWVFASYTKPGQRILDTHLGSGSSAVAAHYAGLNIVGCELDPHYFELACARVERDTKQLDLLEASHG